MYPLTFSLLLLLRWLSFILFPWSFFFFTAEFLLASVASTWPPATTLTSAPGSSKSLAAECMNQWTTGSNITCWHTCTCTCTYGLHNEVCMLTVIYLGPLLLNCQHPLPYLVVALFQLWSPLQLYFWNVSCLLLSLWRPLQQSLPLAQQVSPPALHRNSPLQAKTPDSSALRQPIIIHYDHALSALQLYNYKAKLSSCSLLALSFFRLAMTSERLYPVAGIKRRQSGRVRLLVEVAAVFDVWYVCYTMHAFRFIFSGLHIIACHTGTRTCALNFIWVAQ